MQKEACKRRPMSTTIDSYLCVKICQLILGEFLVSFRDKLSLFCSERNHGLEEKGSLDKAL
jgi:hypothetical protein